MDANIDEQFATNAGSRVKRIKKFGVMQAAKLSGMVYFLLGAIFIIPMSIVSSVVGDSIPGFPVGGGITLVFIPIVYGIMGFIMGAIGCLIYNVIAKWVGGLEVEVETIDHPL